MKISTIGYRTKRKALGVFRTGLESWMSPTHSGLPIPPPKLRELTTLNRLTIKQHIDDVKRVADILVDCLESDGANHDDIASVLDFGCGCGRILRHLKETLPGAKLVGVDVDQELLSWAEINLAQIGDWHLNGYEPPSRFAASTFDVIYAISVFTHLTEETQQSWLTEFARILKPGGRALLSVRELRPKDLQRKEWDHVNDSGMAIRNRKREVARRSWTGRDAVLEEYIDVKHSEEYCRKEWSGKFDVHTFHHGVLPVGQSIVVLQKR